MKRRKREGVKGRAAIGMTRASSFLVKLPFAIRLPWAPSANMIWRSFGGGRGGRVYISKSYKQFLESAYAEYLRQGAPKIDDDTPAVAVVLRLFPPSRRPYDVDNRIKPTLDALTKLGFWLDDKIVRKVTVVANEPVQGGAIIAEIELFDNETERTTRGAVLSWYGLKPLKTRGYK